MTDRASKLIPIATFRDAPLFLLITACLMLQPISTDLYLASLPGLTHVFKVDAATVQLTLSLFVLGFGAAQLIVGPLSDRFGRRPVLLAGLSIYAIASLLCALSPSIWLLIFSRFLQALGCCSGVVIARAIVRDAYAPEDSVKLISKASSWLSLAPLLGPILGSYLQVKFGWRAAFFTHALLATSLLCLVFLRLPETNPHKNPAATQLSGLLANFRLVLGAAVFWRYALPGALSYGAIFAFISGSSVALIQILHFPTQYFGYCFAFGVSGYLSGTVLCRHLHQRFGDRITLRIGTSLSLLAGLIFLVFVSSQLIHWTLVPAAMFFTMMAHGINFPVAQSNSVTPFPQQAGTAAGLMGALYMLVAFVVGTIVSLFNQNTLLPLAIISCVLGICIFASAALLQAPKEPHRV